MKRYLVTIETQIYNPIKHKWEVKQLTGEFEVENKNKAKRKAKDEYAFELDTEINEIKVVKVELIED